MSTLIEMYKYNIVKLHKSFIAIGSGLDYSALFLKLIGTCELRNRDPIGTQCFMK